MTFPSDTRAGAPIIARAAPIIVIFERALGFARSAGPALAIAAVAAALDLAWGANNDVAWLIDLAERTLAGQTPYVDFFEVNPPASIYLYVPSVAAARFVGLSSETMTLAFGVAAALACLALSSVILRRAGLAAQFGGTGLALAAGVLLIGPGRMFDQRDAVALLAMTPYLGALVARAERAPLPLALALLVGIGAGATMAIKPHYALALLAPSLYVARRAGWREIVQPEAATAVAVAGLYGAAVVAAFPAFIHETLPLMAAIYTTVRQSLGFLLTQPMALVWEFLALLLLTDPDRRWRAPDTAIPGLAACGAFACYLIQGKGWSYQLYPALALMTFAASIGPLRATAGGWRIALAAAALAMAGLYEGSQGVGIALAEGALAASFAVSALIGSRRSGAPFALPGPRDIAIGASGALAFALMAIGQTTDPLEAPIAALGPHPSVLSISGELGTGFPLVRHVHGVWAQRVGCLIIADGVIKLTRARPDDVALRARLDPYLRLERDRLVEDILHNRPDAILVSSGPENVIDFSTNDPVVVAALADYRPVGAVGDARRTTTLLARRDHALGLRGAVAATPDPAQ